MIIAAAADQQVPAAGTFQQIVDLLLRVAGIIALQAVYAQADQLVQMCLKLIRRQVGLTLSAQGMGQADDAAGAVDAVYGQSRLYGWSGQAPASARC